jgi:DNA (cytosine-5)-methyltransferase 1
MHIQTHDPSDKQPTAVEFFSGIGAFAAAARITGIRVVTAFDQSFEANQCYGLNFPLKPIAKNLDSLDPEEIPQADIWWLSPPCKPYTVRGNRRDVDDPRAASFLNLIRAIPIRKPETVIVENVSGFAESRARSKFVKIAEIVGMHVVDFDLCATQFGIPMKRPRRFVVASRRSIEQAIPNAQPMQPLKKFLHEGPHDPLLYLDLDTVTRFADALNLIDADDRSALCICFTSNYWKSMRASGSYLREHSGAIRRFSPSEILRLMGCPHDYQFPPEVTLQARLRLAGNSVNVNCIIHLLKCLGYTSEVEPAQSLSPSPIGIPQ